MGFRRRARELALQSLYLCDTCHLSKEAAVKATLGEAHEEQEISFYNHLVQGVIEKKEEIDTLLRRYTQNWDISRMAVVDRNILRIATYEILSDIETPISVILDEAIEIAKTYSTEDSSKFVNGILDKIKQVRFPANGSEKRD